ncbi:MAG TPA: hypothetical protein VFV38_35515 [Ktedonobacteraceae bacterium]|nr:hypothetical protein [Ktedonobacteraceae bacterium]
MESSKQANGPNGTPERAWEIFQATPSYVERFREGRSSCEAETASAVQTFCGSCGFWIQGAHQCPTGQEVRA